jgi:hypothetical protein
MSSDAGKVTGTPDPDYNVIWFTEACLSNAARLETYIRDAQEAGNQQLVDFFRKAQADSRKGAELGKEMLRTLLAAPGKASS